MRLSSLIASPFREYISASLVAGMLVIHLFVPEADPVLLALAVIGAVPLIMRAAHDILEPRISIDVFNLFAVGISVASGEAPSAAFIVLMINSADVLEWHTGKRTQHAVEALLRMKPQTAVRITGDAQERVKLDDLRVGDIVLANTGELIAVDGVVVHGRALVNEALVTGESLPVEKRQGSKVIMSTVVDSGAVKVRATHIGKESTIERMAALMRSAALHKSQPERLADKFASWFLPAVLVFGAGVYLVTRNVQMTAAIFLVACADDMAVAIPLAMTAALGHAARKGIIVKGGIWLHALSRVRTLVLDKTGTLTFGAFRLDRVTKLQEISDKELWTIIGVTEKFSEHPVGHALYALAQQRVGSIPDPDVVDVRKGQGIVVQSDGQQYGIGDDKLIEGLAVEDGEGARRSLEDAKRQSLGTTVLVVRDKKALATLSLADTPRPEAAGSLLDIRRLGIRDIIMFTGDDVRIAQRVASQLGIVQVRAGMLPERKLTELTELPNGPVAMVGDGVNDAPALARADVGIAMGSGGTAIASEAADVIILNDNLSKIGELIRLGRKTVSVIHWDIAIWALSNAVGFTLVLTGVAGPAFAAFYNFATDFLPLINSSRLFRYRA